MYFRPQVQQGVMFGVQWLFQDSIDLFAMLDRERALIAVPCAVVLAQQDYLNRLREGGDYLCRMANDPGLWARRDGKITNWDYDKLTFELKSLIAITGRLLEEAARLQPSVLFCDGRRTSRMTRYSNGYIHAQCSLKRPMIMQEAEGFSFLSFAEADLENRNQSMECKLVVVSSMTLGEVAAAIREEREALELIHGEYLRLCSELVRTNAVFVRDERSAPTFFMP